MSWSHVGKSQKKYACSYVQKYPSIPRNQRFKTYNRCTVSTTTKVITCALVVLILMSPVAAVYMHNTCTSFPVQNRHAKANKVDMRSVLIDASYPSSFKVANLFMNLMSEFPSSFKMAQGVMDFMEVFVRRYDMNKTENYPNLAKAQVGKMLTPLSGEQKVQLAKALFDSYQELETSKAYQGCNWGSRMILTGTCVTQTEDASLVTVDYVRSSSWLGRIYESTEQQAVFSFEGNTVYMEVISHIQDEKYDPKLELIYEDGDYDGCVLDSVS